MSAAGITKTSAMYLLQIVLSIGLFAIGITAEATAPAGACLICGPGKVVKNPAGIFEFPGQPSMTCAALEALGLQGLLKPKKCQKLRPLLSQCGCAIGDLKVPAPAPRSKPQAALVCPSVPEGGCSVCGEGSCITDPFLAIPLPPKGIVVPCGQLQQSGYDGYNKADTMVSYLSSNVPLLLSSSEPAVARKATLQPHSRQSW